MEYRIVTASESSSRRARGLTLAEIARRFASPVTEEQAWAVCHQCAKLLLVLGSRLPLRAPQLGLDNVIVSVEGTTEIVNTGKQRHIKQHSYHDYKQLTSDLGLLIYSLLDHGVPAEQERALSFPLENLIDWMTRNDVTRLQDDITTMPGDIAVTEDNIFVMMQDNITVMQSDAAVKPDDITVVQDDITVVQDDITMIQADITMLQDDVTMMQDDITVMQDDITVMQNDITVMQDDVTVKHDDITVMENDIAIVEDMIPSDTHREFAFVSDSDSLPDFTSLCSSPGSFHTRDSGINEEDCGTHSWEDLMDVMKSCESHVLEVVDSNAHYRGVCRTMVVEAIEIGALQDDEENIPRDSVDTNVVSHWSELMKDLEKGIPLHHVPENSVSVRGALQLSDYEILLMNISNFDRNTLMPVMVDVSPRERRKSSPPALFLMPLLMDSLDLPVRARRASYCNLHSSLMYEIKSRPPLKPVSERQINPHPLFPCPATPMESLMAEILSPPPLKKVPPRMQRLGGRVDFSDTEDILSPQKRYNMGHTHGLAITNKAKKKKIKRTRSLRDKVSRAISFTSPRPNRHQYSSTPARGPHRAVTLSSRRDLGSTSLALQRLRHQFQEHGEDTSLQMSPDPTIVEETPSQLSLWNTSIGSEVLMSGAEISSLSDPDRLTLAEVRQIRGTATKADLINLQLLEKKVFQEICNGKLCFLCRKKKFSFFSRPNTCYICQRLVCSGCCKKRHLKPATANDSTVSGKVSICVTCCSLLLTENTDILLKHKQ